MAKTSSVEKNNHRRKLVARDAAKRKALKAIIMDQSKPLEERFRAQLKLSAMPRNGSKIRIRNRCEVTGRPRAYYRKLGMSRVALRQLGNSGVIPGLVKSSW
ncbi:MAG: 30S ribosomal protein S14 [Rhizobiaceae bacterium]|nr:30S ribosomal protein S14 [Rhizobiaceae bacterium]